MFALSESRRERFLREYVYRKDSRYWRDFLAIPDEDRKQRIFGDWDEYLDTLPYPPGGSTNPPDPTDPENPMQPNSYYDEYIDQY